MKEMIVSKKPLIVKCDCCGKEYDLSQCFSWDRSIPKQFAVLTYYEPSGGFSSDIITSVRHYCSSSCLCSKIPQLYFNAKVSIPVGGIYHDNSDRK